MAGIEKPRYEHKCKKCVFCGVHIQSARYRYEIWYCADGRCRYYDSNQHLREKNKGIINARESNDQVIFWDCNSSSPDEYDGDFWWEVYKLVQGYLELMSDPSVSPNARKARAAARPV